MPKSKSLDEDRLPLFVDGSEVRIIDFPRKHIGSPTQNVHRTGPLLKGVANQLGRWPSDLFSSFLTASVVVSGLALVVFVSMIVCSPVTNDDNCCELKISEDERFFNVYFVKEAAEVWSEREFCYIEAAARKQPEMTIHVINLIRASDASDVNTSEDIFKIALAARSNVLVADLPINEFFSKSKLSRIANNLSNRLLLMAAKAYLLWNSPGIAMHPSAYCNLLTINTPRLTKGSEDYASNKLAVIDPNIDLQATQVHCQAFPGFLLQEISHNSTQIHSLRDALDKFCPRIDNCPEVRVLDLKSQCSINIFDCPAVYTIGNL